MDRKFFIGWLIVFVCWFTGSYVVHGLLLHADYTALQDKLFRTPADSQAHFPLMIVAHVLLSGALVWIYSRGREAGRSWLGQGVRFGVAVAFLTVVPTYIIYYVVQPMPEALVVKQIVFDGALTVLLGIVVAWWYRVVPNARMTMQRGSCHCGKVAFEYEALAFPAVECNCSICRRKGAIWQAVDTRSFRIVSGQESLGLYQFGTKTAKHFFCGNCGVSTFSNPRIAPDKWVVNLRCVDGVDLGALKVVPFDGQNWETAAQALMTSRRPDK